jgi:hypothetical protein
VLRHYDEAGFASPDRRFFIRRQHINSSARHLDHTAFRTVLYALTGHYGDPGDHLAEAQSFADSQGLLVVGRYMDTTGDSLPYIRPGWARVRQAIAEGRADGALTVSRVSVSANDQMYESELQWFAQQRAALWLVRPEMAI